MAGKPEADDETSADARLLEVDDKLDRLVKVGVEYGTNDKLVTVAVTLALDAEADVSPVPADTRLLLDDELVKSMLVL